MTFTVTSTTTNPRPAEHCALRTHERASERARRPPPASVLYVLRITLDRPTSDVCLVSKLRSGSLRFFFRAFFPFPFLSSFLLLPFVMRWHGMAWHGMGSSSSVAPRLSLSNAQRATSSPNKRTNGVVSSVLLSSLLLASFLLLSLPALPFRSPCGLVPYTIYTLQSAHLPVYACTAASTSTDVLC